LDRSQYKKFNKTN